MFNRGAFYVHSISSFSPGKAKFRVLKIASRPPWEGLVSCTKNYFFPGKAKFHVLKSLNITSSPWKTKFHVPSITSFPPGKVKFQGTKNYFFPGKAKFRVLKRSKKYFFPPIIIISFIEIHKKIELQLSQPQLEFWLQISKSIASLGRLSFVY